MRAVGLEFDQAAVNFFDKEDEARLAQARMKQTVEFSRMRKQRKIEKKKRDMELKKKEGLNYKGGSF